MSRNIKTLNEQKAQFNRHSSKKYLSTLQESYVCSDTTVCLTANICKDNAVNEKLKNELSQLRASLINENRTHSPYSGSFNWIVNLVKA